MAFDKNHTSLGMKIVIVFFAVVLVISMCLPFFSSCSSASTTATSSSDSTETTSTDSTVTTVASVKAQYQTVIDSLTSKLADDPDNLAYMANLGNNYMDCASAMYSASDATAEADTVTEAFQSAVTYYDQYLAAVEGGAEADDDSVAAVTVDRAVCEYYAGDSESAIADLTAFLADNDGYEMGWYNLGVFYEETGDTDQAKECYNKVIDLAGESSSTTASIYAQLRLQLIESAEESAAEDADAEGTDEDASDSTDAAATTDATADAQDADTDADSAETDADAASAESDAGTSADASK